MVDQPPALISSSPLSESDYDSILAAVMETGRGRWFLAEYARRNRNADTAMLLSAIERIESLLRSKEGALQAQSGDIADGELSQKFRRDPFADIMALSPEEKIALFT